MIEPDERTVDATETLGALYDAHVDRVFGYLQQRCGDRSVAEDLTSATFISALEGLRRLPPRSVGLPWLLGIARHKLVDHWRRRERDERNLRLAVDDDAEPERSWDRRLDRERAVSVLAQLLPRHRSALTLRYMDGLSVPDMAELLEQSVHATESVLARARRAFRQAYEATEGAGQ